MVINILTWNYKVRFSPSKTTWSTIYHLDPEEIPMVYNLSLNSPKKSSLWLIIDSTSFSTLLILLAFIVSVTSDTIFGGFSWHIDEAVSVKVLLVFLLQYHYWPWKLFWYTGLTDRPGESCHKFSISYCFSVVPNFPIRVPGVYYLAVLNWLYVSHPHLYST